MSKIEEEKPKNVNKRICVLAVKRAVQAHQQRMEEEFFPVLVKEFGCNLVVKFREGKKSMKNIVKIKEFMMNVEKSSIQNILEELKGKIVLMYSKKSQDIIFQVYYLTIICS